MILMAPCIIDFIGAKGLLGAVGGGGPGHSWALKWHRAKPLPLPKPVEISITTQHNSLDPTQQYGP